MTRLAQPLGVRTSEGEPMNQRSRSLPPYRLEPRTPSSMREHVAVPSGASHAPPRHPVVFVLFETDSFRRVSSVSFLCVVPRHPDTPTNAVVVSPRRARGARPAIPGRRPRRRVAHTRLDEIDPPARGVVLLLRRRRRRRRTMRPRYRWQHTPSPPRRARPSSRDSTLSQRRAPPPSSFRSFDRLHTSSSSSRPLLRLLRRSTPLLPLFSKARPKPPRLFYRVV
mmetsp:Transcript_18750/g.74848  ORF Transcript_18750/g.74848 Transcript_18750/m.74848 type:complete len:224 (+) Transcript_18750:269-940(+)